MEFKWHERRNPGKKEMEPFNGSKDAGDAQRDRARIIHSSSFRRLQNKTQILGIGENDFYRTRLTHSLEVAQIGSGICEYQRNREDLSSEIQRWMPSLFQIEAICLSHDIGHPPFGHGGEVALNYFMRSHGGFEGNGQTLRIVSRLGEYSKDHGLDLTRRTMLGLLKYPAIHRYTNNYKISENLSQTNIDWAKPPKCIHDDEMDVLEWIISPFNDLDKERFRSIDNSGSKHFRTIHKSFDTTLMELADDIAYGVHDLEDALELQLVSEKTWQDNVVDKLDPYCEIKERIYFLNEKLFSKKNRERKFAVSQLVNYFIKNIDIDVNKKFTHPLLRYQATMKEPAVSTLELLKKYVAEEVIRKPEVQALEYKGQKIVLRLFEVLSENPDRLLPKSTYAEYEGSGNRARIICDYISGMTDAYATKLYHKLFSPSMGSIFDRL